MRCACLALALSLIWLAVSAHPALADVWFYWALDDPDNGQWNYSGYAAGGGDTIDVVDSTNNFGPAGAVPVSTSYYTYGDDSIRLTYSHVEGGYWTVYIPTDGAGNPPSESPWDQYGWDLSSYRQLEFDVMGAEGGELFAVALIDIDGDASAVLEINEYAQVTTDWQHVRLPMDDFLAGAESDFDIEAVRFIALCNPSYEVTDATVYVDRLVFTPEPSSGLLALLGVAALASLRAARRRSNRGAAD